MHLLKNRLQWFGHISRDESDELAGHHGCTKSDGGQLKTPVSKVNLKLNIFLRPSVYGLQ